MGTMILSNGEKYEGEWKDDVREGKGIWSIHSKDLANKAIKNYKNYYR